MDIKEKDINKKVYLLCSNNTDIEEETNNYIRKQIKKNNIKIYFNEINSENTIKKNYNIFQKKGEYNFKIKFNLKITKGFSLFSGCENIIYIDFSNFNTSLISNFSYMFLNCYNLKYLDLTSFDTSKMTKMNFMFYGCENLQEIKINSFDTKNVTDARGMFGYCKNLVNLNISNFNFKNLKNMEDMFKGCDNLENIIVSEHLFNQIGDILKKYSVTIIYT